MNPELFHATGDQSACGTVEVDKGRDLRVSSVALPPWSSGLGRHPFKVKIAGSNPAGGTTSERPRALFFLRDRLPQLEHRAWHVNRSFPL